uniref:PH domain-containing protein n=1 Tax=Callithrix jacchus TaxID=9483 RepID=A0A8I3W7J8_CALJA
ICQLEQKKESKETSEKMNAKNKESLLEESVYGTSVIVPELEGALYLKEDGKKSWKRRYFLLRASGIYYVPKGKTKTSRDLACFIQFENVNIYYGTQHKMKYKAPTGYCFVLKHPQIQKESQYIKYLCSDDARTLNQWVMGIRIAKYGKTLYDNYQRAMAKAGLASRWTNVGTVSAAAPAQPAQPSTGPKTGTSQPNGQMPQAAHSVSAVLQEAQTRAETWKDKKPALGNHHQPGMPRAPQAPKSSLPLPLQCGGPPDTSSSPATTPKAKGTGGRGFLAPSHRHPPDFMEPPPDFVPPLPPTCAGTEGSELPPPPPPPPLPQPPHALDPNSARLPSAVAKRPPMPPKRHENPAPPGGAGGGEQDFMSDLMKALQKNRGNVS